MKYTKQELENSIKEMQDIVDDKSTSEDIRASIRPSLAEAKKLLSELDTAQPAAQKPTAAEIVKAVKKGKKKTKAVRAKKMTKEQKQTLKGIVARSKELTKMYAGYSEGALRRDAGRSGKRPGKRTSASGETYYESRPNRSDISSSAPHLAKGGETSKKYSNDRVVLGIYRKKYVVISAEKDDNRGYLWANEYMPTKEEAVDFCETNGMQIISDKIFQPNKEKSREEGRAYFDLPNEVYAQGGETKKAKQPKVFKVNGENKMFYWNGDKYHSGEYADAKGRGKRFHYVKDSGYNEVGLVALRCLSWLVSIEEDFGSIEDQNNNPDLKAAGLPHLKDWNDVAKSVIAEEYRTDLKENHIHSKINFTNDWKNASETITDESAGKYDEQDQLKKAKEMADKVVSIVDFDRALEIYREFGNEKNAINASVRDQELYSQDEYVDEHAQGGETKKSKQPTAKDWYNCAKTYLKMAYNLEPNDMDLNMELAEQELADGTSPVEYVDNYADKHDLYKREEFKFEDTLAVLKMFGFKHESQMAEGGAVASNQINVYGYDTDHLTLAGKQAFERAMAEIGADTPENNQEPVFKRMKGALKKIAMLLDELLWSGENSSNAHRLLQEIGIYNYQTGMALDTQWLNDELAERHLQHGGHVSDVKELWYVTDAKGSVKNISGTADAANTFAKKLSGSTVHYTNVPKRDWDAEKVSVGNIKGYAQSHSRNYARGGETSKHVKGIFTIDDQKTYPGFHIPGQYWNGWNTPVFEKQTALEILKDFTIPYREEGEKIEAVTDWSDDMPVDEYDYEETGPHEITVNGVKKKVYGIGNYSWIWSEVKKRAQGGKMARGGKLKSVLEDNAEKIIKHYLPTAEPQEVFSSEELLHPGNYIVDEDTYGDGSKRVFISVGFGSEYTEAEAAINADYEKYVKFLTDLASKYRFNAEITTIQQDEVVVFILSNPRTATKGYEEGGEVDDDEEMGEKDEDFDDWNSSMMYPEEPEYETDAFITDVVRGGYDVSVEAKFLGHYDNYDEAVKALKTWTDENGYYPTAWSVNERGTPTLIDGEGNHLLGKGGQTSRGRSRDRKFKSREPHEQKYKRKTSPKNPKYKKHEKGGRVKGTGTKGYKYTGKKGSLLVSNTNNSVYDLTKNERLIALSNEEFYNGKGQIKTSKGYIPSVFFYEGIKNFEKGGKISKEDKTLLLTAGMYLAAYKNTMQPSTSGYQNITNVISKFKSDPTDFGNVNMAVLHLGNYRGTLTDKKQKASLGKTIVRLMKFANKHGAKNTIGDGGETDGIPEIVKRAMTETVVDIGQLTKQDIKDLNKYVKKGVLIKGKGGAYPKLKTVYAIKGFDIEKDRELQVKQMLDEVERLEPGTVKYIKKARGGKVTFDDKVKAISSDLTGKKVEGKYRKSYGKKYSKKEAIQAAKRIAGAMKKKEN